MADMMMLTGSEGGGFALLARADERTVLRTAAYHWSDDRSCVMASCTNGWLRLRRNCKIDSIEKFGILVEILPGKTGLVHTSELDVDRTVSPDAFSAEDRLDVKLLEVSLQAKTPCSSHLSTSAAHVGGV